jgi:hypothetical protein
LTYHSLQKNQPLVSGSALKPTAFKGQYQVVGAQLRELLVLAVQPKAVDMVNAAQVANAAPVASAVPDSVAPALLKEQVEHLAK